MFLERFKEVEITKLPLGGSKNSKYITTESSGITLNK